MEKAKYYIFSLDRLAHPEKEDRTFKQWVDAIRQLLEDAEFTANKNDMLDARIEFVRITMESDAPKFEMKIIKDE